MKTEDTIIGRVIVCGNTRYVDFDDDKDFLKILANYSNGDRVKVTITKE